MKEVRWSRFAIDRENAIPRRISCLSCYRMRPQHGNLNDRQTVSANPSCPCGWFSSISTFPFPPLSLLRQASLTSASECRVSLNSTTFQDGCCPAVPRLPPPSHCPGPGNCPRAYIFHRHGDRTSKEYPPASLTDLGYQEVYSSGSFYRARYLDDSSPTKIYGISQDVPLALSAQYRVSG